MHLNKTYALILESQGFKTEALEIYEKLLKKYPDDKEIVESIKRLKTRKKFDGVNIIRLNEFNKINQKNRYIFEKWLSEF